MRIATAHRLTTVTERTDATRVVNFSAGPAILPASVLMELQQALVDCDGQGLSILGLSHRAPLFDDIKASASDRLRRLLALPDSFDILFFPFGATLHFSALALNLLPEDGRAAYFQSGYWSEAATAEARRYGHIDVIPAPWARPEPEPGLLATDAAAGQAAHTAAGVAADQATDAADPSNRAAANSATTAAAADAKPSYAYAHYCDNETIDGVEWPVLPHLPEVRVPLVADMSSNLLTRPVDFTRFGLIYASAQKNLGSAGLSVVLVRKDLLGRARSATPSLLDYGFIAARHSNPNTAPVFAMLVLERVLAWCESEGGLPEMAVRADQRSRLLYDFFDQSSLYLSSVPAELRSRLNLPFSLRCAELTAPCLAQAQQAGLVQLAGHRSQGGLRASLYNAMPLSGVERLRDFLFEFERTHV